MPLRNILAIPLALALGQAAWAQTPTGHPEVQYKDAPDFGYPSTGGGGKSKKDCLDKAKATWNRCMIDALNDLDEQFRCNTNWKDARDLCDALWGGGE